MRNWMCAGALALATSAGLAGDGLRVAAWNITFYNGSNSTDIQNVVYGVFNGSSMDPDVILLQEITNRTAMAQLINHLNNAPNSPGDWAQGTYFSASTSGGINTAFAYRTSKLDLLGSEVVKPGTSGQNPRNVVRYDVRLKGYSSEEATISMYPVHMKAGSGSSDQSRRLIESQAITADAASLPTERNFLVGGDFNIQSSSQSAFSNLVGSPYNTGLFVDPIRTPGNWNNNSSFRYVHTQDPASQMDDRYDMLLISQTFGDGVGLEYIGDFDTPFSTSTWNDPDHSYRCYGNDGTTYNAPMNISNNASVGNSIATSIRVLCSNNGHAPVYFDASVPAVITADTALIDFGDVEVGATAQAMIEVGSGGDTALWGALIEDSSYSFMDSSGLLEPVGSFADAAGGGLVSHTIEFTDSGVEGPTSGSLFVMSNDTETPLLEIPYTANVVSAACVVDLNGDGIVDNGDINAFLDLFLAQDLTVDFNSDGIIDNGDIIAFVQAFLAGC